MESGKIKIPDSNLPKGTELLFQINKLLPYLSIRAHEYTIKELNKIVIKSLSPKAMCKYVGESGDDLKDKADIMEMILLIKNKIKLKAEAAALEQKANPKLDHDNQKFKQGKEKLNIGESKRFKSPSQKHYGTHKWKDCPDYKPPTKVNGEAKRGNSQQRKTYIWCKQPTKQQRRHP